MSDSAQDMDGIAAEAASFNQRISERRAIGFVPDIRRSVKSDYFYKSFWRDPPLRPTLSRSIDKHLALLRKHAPPQARILDVGRGTGHFALELARNGYDVVGFDVAECGGPGYLNRFSASISEVSAGVRLPSGMAVR